MLRTTIDAVCVGTVDAFGPNGEPSAIRKKRMTGPFRVGAEGPAGDAHGDTVHHGGSEKAVHHYPFEHYHLWQTELPTAASHFEQPPFFGENISTSGLTETSVCVGDIFRAGTVLLQVSEVRQPCWKLAHRSGVPDLARRVQETGRTGWFYRVIETGTIEVGVTMELEGKIRSIRKPSVRHRLKKLTFPVSQCWFDFNRRYFHIVSSPQRSGFPHAPPALRVETSLA